jgi:micrococcal nuclease
MGMGLERELLPAGRVMLMLTWATDRRRGVPGENVLHFLFVAAAFAVLTTVSGAVPAIVEGPATTVDGDTVTVGSYTVRLKGVDAPENWMKGGPEATAFMRSIVGDWLKCELTGEKTRGREVGFCRNKAGQDTAEEITKKGLALCCPRYSERYCKLEQTEAQRRQPRALLPAQGRPKMRASLRQGCPEERYIPECEMGVPTSPGVIEVFEVAKFGTTVEIVAR